MRNTSNATNTCTWYLLTTYYKVRLREVPRGVAQERNTIRSYEILHTCLEVVAVSTHH